MTHTSVHIQIAPESIPTTPCWFSEVAIVSQILKTYGLVKLIETKVQFARARFDHYDLIDFVAVLIGYALSGERTLQAFYDRLTPFASTFMAVFDRSRLPHRSTLSRFLDALDQPSVEALRSVFQDDLVARTPLGCSPGGLWDRLGQHWFVVDIDATKQAARQLGGSRRRKKEPWHQLPEGQAVGRSPPEGQVTHAQGGSRRELYGCLAVPLRRRGPVMRLRVAAHPTSGHNPPVGVIRKETV